jgi:hypothetical protein
MNGMNRKKQTRDQRSPGPLKEFEGYPVKQKNRTHMKDDIGQMKTQGVLAID